MRRRWNAWIWIGFLIVLAGPISYFLVFIRWPVTRDVPWVPLLFFVAGLTAIAAGVRRARREPAVWRGRVAGPVLLALGVFVAGFFSYGMFYEVRRLPPSTGAPRVGQRAPDFTLTDQNGRTVALAQLLASAPGGTPARGVVLIFYRGYW